MPPAGAAREKVPRNNLTEKQRHRLIEHLLEGSTKGVLGQGAINEAAETFSCSRYQVSGIWKRYQKQRSDGVTDINLRNGRGGHSGRKGIDVEKLTAALVEVPLKNRTTQRAVAKQLGIPQQTLQRNLKKLGMRAASRFLKPFLTESGRARRLAWALRWVRDAHTGTGGTGSGQRVFDTMDNVVMVDEKWFFIKKQGQRYYLGQREELPTHRVQHKSHIKKVMFLAAVARPRRNTVANRNFDGKIGIFPFTRQVQAQRNSRHRAAGTWVTTMVEVTKEVYKAKMLEDVFPAIKAQWPGGPGEVFVQQDNAPAHNIANDPDIVAAGTADGWNIKLLNQPPNSPDTNILDLGFFNSIQSLQDRTTLNTVDELIEEVKRVFTAQESEALGRVWTTYQSVLEKIMLAKGDNDFKMPHLHKKTANRRGAPIPRALPCSEEAWLAAHA
ncbi:unnamed protein product [Ascophyllum nodosum]